MRELPSKTRLLRFAPSWQPANPSMTSVRVLEKAMLDYLDQRNENPEPCVWSADADLILGKVERVCKRISRSGHAGGKLPLPQAFSAAS